MLDETTHQNPLLQDILLKPTSGYPIPVKAHLLYTHSTVFRDMIDITIKSNSGLRQSPNELRSFEIDTTETNLAFFVQMLKGRKPWKRGSWA
ncbi:hypothetical protein M231_05560 [Tremella mesenterica]|uniref:BTB domain-containing protein n=1 Tax=Tremella mesenterica TaxID=5217 RepID=A0A4Q1BHU0_TREME|nr:hypothetical protein M231_05560 [Tremella mesenterica]